MQHITKSLAEQLKHRKSSGRLRHLTLPVGKVDFYSNDYLGFAQSPKLSKAIQLALNGFAFSHGSGGARLISGNHPFTEQLEQSLADFYNSEAALLYANGFAANLGLFSAIGQQGDSLISDELIHASTIEGFRLSKANRFIFKHNDLQDLEQKLQQATGRIFVAIESLYSMDGDFAPLAEIVQLTRKYQAALIVDEAHSNGVCGPQGKGSIAELGLEKEVFARVMTFGKAMGTHGAVVLGSTVLRDYLLNYSRPFIYSTAPPLHQWIAVRESLKLLPQAISERKKLKQYIHLFDELSRDLPWQILGKNSWIQAIVIPGNQQVREVAYRLEKEGFAVKPIVSPTVPAGKERIRICLHSFNTKAEIKALVASITQYSQSKKKLSCLIK